MMHKYLTSNIKLTKRNLTLNVLRKLFDKNIGTNEVMNNAVSMSKQFVRKRFNDKLVKYVMQMKIVDAEKEQQSTRHEFYRMKSQYYQYVNKNGLIDMMFHRMMRDQVEKLWYEGKIKNSRKVKYLVNKWRTNRDAKVVDVRNVKYRDNELNVEVCDKNEEMEMLRLLIQSLVF